MRRNGFDGHGISLVNISWWTLGISLSIASLIVLAYPPVLSSILKCLGLGVVLACIHYLFWENGNVFLLVIATMLPIICISNKLIDLYPKPGQYFIWIEALLFICLVLVGHSGMLNLFQRYFKIRPKTEDTNKT